MLQQESPRDYVIASGRQHTVREFVRLAAAEMGITLEFQGEGAHERGVIAALATDFRGGLNVGDTIVRVDPQYFRPAEVETLCGDSAQAHALLGWTPQTSFAQLVREMALADLKLAEREAGGLLGARHGRHLVPKMD